MGSPQQEGRDFEKEWAKEFGLKLVPGSGAVWYSKLDLKGKVARWSLKFTRDKSFRLTQEDVREAVEATQGVAGDGSIPLWGIRIGTEEYDMVLMRKNDFVLMQEGEISFLDQPRVKPGDIRRERSRVPVLLREENE